jgi:glycosyl hydrolase family 44
MTTAPSRTSLRLTRRACGAVALSIACAACPGTVARAPDATPTKAPEPWELAESAYDGAVHAGWQESGSAPRDLSAVGPVKIHFGTSGEWVLTHPGLDGHYGGLLFRVKEPEGEGEFLQVRLGSDDRRIFPNIKLKPDHRTDVGNGWAQVFVPMSELNPAGVRFDRVIFQPFRPFADQWVSIDGVGLAKVSAPPSAAHLAVVASSSVATPNLRRGRARIACDAKATKISPFIYGIAFGEEGWDKMRVTARRWGGNPTTRYNWETHFSNAAQDWFFENRAGGSYTEFLASSAAHQVASALTIPMIGWVAKDATSYSFPVSVFGPQNKTDPWRSDAGNGVSPSGANITPGPPSRTSSEAPPVWAKRWIATIRANDAKTGRRGVYEYILDNEPMLWHATHRDVHPDPVGYDELLDRTIQYASAIRDVDPEALIAGPAEWGWSGYLYSALDLAGAGHRADRLAHGDLPLVAWYLRKLHEYEQKRGTRLLDVFDLHYYPQASNVYAGGVGGSDRETQLLRLRSTRSLWDPTYVDESWIKDTIRLLPRMREWVDTNYPGRGISIGEWNFGGEKDITGALATAEVLGRFAEFGVTSAFYWTAPPWGSPSSFAFLAYRNFDGKGGRFLDWYLPTTSPEQVSLFASRDTDGKHIVVVAINMDPDAPIVADLDLTSCGTIASRQIYTYANGSTGLTLQPSPEQDAGVAKEWPLPPWSITVMDMQLR